MTYTYTNTSIAISGGFSSAANAYVSEPVRRRGSTTGIKSGTVTGLNATVHYSGGLLYDGSIALGLTSGGSGDCRVGGTTFYQPVVEALSKYGVSVL